jgi:hypothetical protein
VTRVHIGLSFKDYTGRLMTAVRAREWAEGEEARFYGEWQRLADAGAGLATARLVDGEIQFFPSEDFTMHCEKWGIIP